MPIRCWVVMRTLLPEMIMFGMGAAVSPMVLAIAIVFLTSKNHPKAQVIALAAGGALALAAVGILVLKGGSASLGQGSGQPSTLSGGIDTFLGVLLILIGIKTYVSRNKPKKKKAHTGSVESLGRLSLRNIGLGAVLATTNKSMILYFEAAKKAAESGLSFAQEALALTVTALLYLLPILLPLLIVTIAPARSAKVLERVDKVLVKNGVYIVTVTSLVFGIYLLYKGLTVIA